MTTNTTAANPISIANTILVYLPKRNFIEVAFNANTTASDVILYILSSQFVASRPNSENVNPASIYPYALKLVCRALNPNDQLWLHTTQNIQHFHHVNSTLMDKGWVMELCIRYIPLDLDNLYQNDPITFNYLYQQILEEFLQLELSNNHLLSNQELIAELGCLELRRVNTYLTPQGLEKNFDTLESDINIYLPASFVSHVKVISIPLDWYQS